jgi:signal transduction histidine kinase
MRPHHPERAMYDQIGDALTSITMQLRSAIHADVTPSRAPGKANGASGSMPRAAGWARKVAAELGSVLLDTLGLAVTLEWHLHQFQKCTGIMYELAVNNAGGFDLRENYAAAMFDIYSETLSNVARHSGASRVVIVLTITPHEVTLVMRDNGIGLGAEVSRSSRGGIGCMRARAQSLKGECELAGARNVGTTVTASLPIAAAL